MGTNTDPLPITNRDAYAIAHHVLNRLSTAQPLSVDESHLAHAVASCAFYGEAGACSTCGESVVDVLRAGIDGCTCLSCLKDESPLDAFVPNTGLDFNAWSGVAHAFKGVDA